MLSSFNTQIQIILVWHRKVSVGCFEIVWDFLFQFDHARRPVDCSGVGADVRTVFEWGARAYELKGIK